MDTAAAKSVLTHFAPVVYLHSKEEYKPVSVDWYIDKCSLRYDSIGPGSSEVLKVINPSTPINAQKYKPSFGGDMVYSSYATMPKETRFYTTLRDSKHKTGSEVNNVPFYCAAYETNDKNPAEGLKGHCDLIYGFFYAWDDSNRGAIPGAAGLFAAHEGDWEHIIVRIGRDTAGGYSSKSKILGAFFQAHGSKDHYSNWYYPPESKTDPSPKRTFEWEPQAEGKTVRVYAAWGSHGSYVSAGTQSYWGLWPDDSTDSKGTRWPGSNSGIFLMTGKEDWNDYNGHFGDHGGPRSPFVQGWFGVNTRQGGPDTVTTIQVARHSKEMVRGFSKEFKLGYPKKVVWSVTAKNVKPETIENLRFTFSQTFLKTVEISSVKNGQPTEGYFQVALMVSNLWIEGTHPTVSENKVFQTLGIDELFLTATAQ